MSEAPVPPRQSINVIAGNDVLEVMTYDLGNRRQYMHHDRVTLDQRAKLMVSLVQSWGAANLLSDAFKEMTEQPHRRTSPTIEHLVFIAADTADAIYAEAEKRGWSLKLPTFTEGMADEP